MNHKTKRNLLWTFFLLSAIYFAGAVRHQRANEELQTAALHGNLVQVQDALRHGADVDVCDRDGYTPLMYAAEAGHVRMAQVLLAHGASVNATDYAQATVLSLAAGHGSEKVVSLLLKKGAELTGENARPSFVFASSYPRIAALLKKAQAQHQPALGTR